jgi:HAD superfamily hydrolase (TIGR01509 family)
VGRHRLEERAFAIRGLIRLGYKTGVIRGFLFDLDGTLIDSERETAEAMARALLKGQGIALEQYDRDFIIGRSWIAIYDSLKTRYPQLTWNREETVAHTAIFRDEVFAEQGITVLPGARDVLTWTKQYPRALVTGSSRVEVTQVLPLVGPMAHFETIVAAEDVSRSKPAPDGYQKALAAIGLSPGQCMVIEDSVAGISAGRTAGCLVLAVRAGNFGGWDQSAAHHVIDTLEQLTPSLVEQLARDYGFVMDAAP